MIATSLISDPQPTRSVNLNDFLSSLADCGEALLKNCVCGNCASDVDMATARDVGVEIVEGLLPVRGASFAQRQGHPNRNQSSAHV